MVKNINLKSVEDVKKLNRHATRFDFDIFVHGNGKNEIIDAKSLLGLTSLINKNNLRLVTPDHINHKAVYQGIENLFA